MPRSLLLAVLLAPLLLAGAGPIKGQEFPDFTAKDALTGQEFSLRDLRGKVVLIDFWATWCGPCVRELPNVKRVYGRYKTQGYATARSNRYLNALHTAYPPNVKLSELARRQGITCKTAHRWFPLTGTRRSGLQRGVLPVEPGQSVSGHDSG